MIITTTEHGVLDQHDRWIEKRTEYTRQARECNHLALATLQGYANVKAHGANVRIGAVYKAVDSYYQETGVYKAVDSYYQVTGVFAQIDSDRNGVRRIDVYVEMRAVDGNGNRQCGISCELLTRWHEYGYALTEIVGAPLE